VGLHLGSGTMRLVLASLGYSLFWTPVVVWQCVFLLVSVSLVERRVIAYGVWGYAAGGKTLKEDSPQSTGGSISFANSTNALPIFLASCAEKYMVNRRSQGSIMMISAYASTRSVQSVVSHLSLKVCISLDSSLVSLFGYYLEVVLVHVGRFMLYKGDPFTNLRCHSRLFSMASLIFRMVFGFVGRVLLVS